MQPGKTGGFRGVMAALPDEEVRVRFPPELQHYHTSHMAQPTFTKAVSAGTRVYYFDIRPDKNGEDYLSIAEVPTVRDPKNKRQRIFIHAEDVPRFLEALVEATEKITGVSAI